jgi:hypothetical protein
MAQSKQGFTDIFSLFIDQIIVFVIKIETIVFDVVNRVLLLTEIEIRSYVIRKFASILFFILIPNLF